MKGNTSVFWVRIGGLITRRIISLVPLPAGITPAPAQPIRRYSSEAATTRLPLMIISAPPPSAIPAGAITTGLGK